MKYGIYISCICLFSLLAGCMRDSATVTPAGGDTRLVSVTINTSNPGLYGLSPSPNETAINTLDIFAFNANGDTETFLCKVIPTNITQVDETKLQVTAEIPYETTVYNFAFIANAADHVSSLGEIARGTSKEELLYGLVHDENEWEGDFTIPMWGESGKIHIPKDTRNTSFHVSMLRMVSRIDVRVSDGIDTELFELAAVELHRPCDSGYIVPDESCWDSDLNRVHTPSIPVTAAVVDTPVAFVPDEGMAVEGIYTYERECGEKYDEVCFLLVGGYYREDGTLTWYRIDFLEDRDDPSSYRHLLRNHLNIINITDVYGPGFEDKEDAIKSTPVNLNASVTEWDMAGDDVLIYGSHLLSVSTNDIVTSNRAVDRLPVTVFTDHPDGWTARVKDAEGANSWLSIVSPDPARGATGEKVELVLCTKENDTGQPRTGTVDIQAGRITYELFVTQTDSQIELEVTDHEGTSLTELIFITDSDDPVAAARTFKVDWSPTGLPCLISAADGGFPVVYTSASDSPGIGLTSLSTGIAALSLEVEPFTAADIAANPSGKRMSTVDFLVTDNSNYKKHTLMVSHLHYYIEVTPKLNSYKMGRDYTAEVLCSGEWELESVADPDGVLESWYADTDAGTFDFRLNKGVADKLATATFVCVERPALKAVLPIRADESYSNCYMVKPGGSVDIPTGNIAPFWRDYFGETLSGNYEIRLYSKDLNNVSDNAVTYAGGVVTVKAPTEECNLVIAAYIGSQIVWTWHVWVTPYDPDNGGATHTYSPGGGSVYILMDRNLGARTLDWSKTHHMGYFYQWGRKDPLPPPRQITDIYDKTLLVDYWVLGTLKQRLDKVSVTADPVANLKNALTMPSSFIVSDPEAGLNDWYTSVQSLQAGNPWNDNGEKGVFDPCPEGWKVPHIISGYSPWQGSGSPTIDSGEFFFRWPSAGNYIFTPYKDAASGDHENFGHMYMWTSDGSGANANALYINATGAVTHSYDAMGRGTGMVVRCVRE